MPPAPFVAFTMARLWCSLAHYSSVLPLLHGHSDLGASMGSPNTLIYGSNMGYKGLNRQVDDLWEKFKVLRQYNMKLNPKKCASGAQLGKFLCFMSSSRSIKANPDKVKDMVDMRPP